MADKTAWGATAPEWDLFLGLGLLGDLLPVVSNPNAKISPHSKMVALGKTPSHYNGLGMAAGLPNWTEKTSRAGQVKLWRTNEDYGICLQTRTVRALDVDIPDPKLAAEVSAAILELAGKWLPTRSRENSGKCLLAFRMAGEHPKRIIRVKDKVVDDQGQVIEPAWNIEFLGNGQQFIAAGTHPSGVRYQWDFDPLVGDEDFPEVDEATFEALWDALTERFGLGDSVSLTSGKRKRGELVVVDDPIARLIEEKGLALGQGRDGQLYIDCPWKAEHSSDTGVAQTAYFPKGTRGYEQGHFKCFHASCAKKTDGDYEVALGLVQEQFEVLAPEEDPRTGEEKMPMPVLMRDTNGYAKPIAHNVLAVLERPDITGLRLRFDTFRDEIVWSPYGQAEWVSFSDEHNLELRARFDRIGFKPVSKDLMRDCVDHVAKRNRFDIAQEWLERLKWDGVSRVEHFAHRYLGTADTPYTRAVSFYLWTALAGRVLEPGVQANMVPILVGAQGVRKSSAVAAISPDPDFFCEIDLNADQDNLARQMRGRMVGEIAELQGLRTRELESIKAFIVRQYENWVPKYKEFAATYARRIVFIGTSNQDDFLADETGNRRWLPMKVTGLCDSEAIKRDRDQLWAEARELFLTIGIDYIPAERLAREEHGQFRAVDAWEDVVARWLAEEDIEGRANGDAEHLYNADILQGALNIGAEKMKRLDELRLAAVMPSLGWERRFIRAEGRVRRAWVKKE